LTGLKRRDLSDLSASAAPLDTRTPTSLELLDEQVDLLGEAFSELLDHMQLRYWDPNAGSSGVAFIDSIRTAGAD
jgi:hypothetical protein